MFGGVTCHRLFIFRPPLAAVRSIWLSFGLHALRLPSERLQLLLSVSDKYNFIVMFNIIFLHVVNYVTSVNYITNIIYW